jgi:membrane associated rhomboid family serine protease
MRYVVAMVFAFIIAALTTIFVGSSVADWVVARQTFESSDDAENLHMLVFVGTNIGGLIVGWLLGWIIAGAGRTKTPAA